MLRLAGFTLLAIAVGACKTPGVGPVIGPEVIAGRADGSVVTLLAGGLDLVRVDLSRRRFERIPLILAAGESCWGLARLSDGTLWTLKGRHTAARLTEGGQLTSQVPLITPQFGIFAAGDHLVFQEAAFTAPSPAFMTGTGASSAALNMLACGVTRASERACWFPDEPAVYLVEVDGHTRHVTLPGLPVVPAEVLLTSDNPARPVRDAFVASSGDIWVLSTGTPPPGAAQSPGGWTLARFGGHGEALGQSRLSEAARLILGADSQRIELLLASGKVGEVAAW
jgi:hypothetical protein